MYTLNSVLVHTELIDSEPPAKEKSASKQNRNAGIIYSQNKLIETNSINKISFTYAGKTFSLTADDFNKIKSGDHDAEGGIGEIRFVNLKPDLNEESKSTTETNPVKFAVKSTNLKGAAAGANMSECKILEHLKKESIGVFVSYVKYDGQAFNIFIDIVTW